MSSCKCIMRQRELVNSTVRARETFRSIERKHIDKTADLHIRTSDAGGAI